jgi:hypothetical protein
MVDIGGDKMLFPFEPPNGVSHFLRFPKNGDGVKDNFLGSMTGSLTCSCELLITLEIVL